MSEHKFTKGPWNFDDGWKLSKTYSCDFTGFELRVGPNSDSPQIKYDEQWRANATLAEAAPELFRCCERFVDGVEAHADEQLKNRMSGHLSFMKSAIKKALGN